MDTEKTLKPGEIAQVLGVTGATIRNYRMQFSAFLSDGANKKTQKRFNQNDLKILSLAKSYLDEQYTYEQVSNILESTNLDDILDQPLPKPEPKVDETSALAIYRETLDAKNETIDILKKEIKWLRTPWYKKIFRDPPE